MLTLTLALLALAPAPGDLLAIRVKRAETIAQGPVEHALILVEDGKIVAIGEDLPVERGIPVLERPDWIATPGLVNCYSRAGTERSQGRGFEPQLSARAEIDPRNEIWPRLLALGVTTVGLYPDGTGIPGQAVVLQPYGKSAQEMLVREPAYLKVTLQSNAASKKQLREAFQKVDEYQEKVAKEREKWEKEREKRKSRSKSKKDDAKDEKKEETEKKEEKKTSGLAQEPEEQPQEQDEKKEDKKTDSGEAFVPPAPDEKVKPFLDLRNKKLTALMSIRKAADYLHLLDVLEKEQDVQWFLHFPLQDDVDLYEVAAKVGEKKLLVVTQPDVTLQPHSLRERNIPAEFARAGAKLALTPRSDSLRGHEDWLPDVGRLVGQGLAREAALAALTLEPARALGLEARLGSLEPDKDANIVFWSADPFEPAARVQAVMLAGEFVVGEEER